MRLWLPFVGLALITFAACGGDDEPGGGNGGSTSSSGTGGTTSSGTGGTTSSGTGGSSSSSGIGGGDICAAEPGDEACITCTRAGCCPQLETCLLDSACVCLLECFLAGTNPPDCLGQCPSSPEVSALVACAATDCAADCV